MKYIRTKDEIWEIMEIKSDYEKTYYHCKHNLIGKRFEEINIIKQADTIKELCDEFILFDKDNLVYVPIDIDFYSKEYIFKYADGDYTEMTKIADTDEIYAAIWTKGNKGEPILKSVAKLNDKKELELI